MRAPMFEHRRPESAVSKMPRRLSRQRHRYCLLMWHANLNTVFEFAPRAAVHPIHDAAVLTHEPASL